MVTSFARRFGSPLSPLRRNKLLLFVVASFVGWTAWLALREVRHPWADLSRGAFTDHFSHMNAARAFTRIGPEIYRRGPALIYPSVDAETYFQLPEDVRYGGSWTGGIYPVPEFRRDKPWVTSWSDRPRLYPPGDLLLVAPVAALYDLTDLSFSLACELLILLFLAYTHVALYFVLRSGLRNASLQTPILIASMAIVYLEAIHWTLEGFYDFAAALPLVLCIDYLRQRRALLAVLCYCIAAFLHFRVFFLAPLVLYAALLIVQDRAYRNWAPRDLWTVACIVALSVVVLGVFMALRKPLLAMPITNFVHHAFFRSTKEPILWLLAVAGVAAFIFAYAGAIVDLAMLAWVVMMLLFVREIQPWHPLLFFVWLLLPAFYARNGAAEAVRGGRFLFLGYIALAVFHNPVWPIWIELLYRT